jgi:hypothetical protein
LFDTHPPVEERIERVNARFERASYRKSRASPAADAPADADAFPKGVSRKDAAIATLAAASAGLAGRRGGDLGAEWGRSAHASAQLVGSLDGARVDYAARLVEALPPELRGQLRNPEGACAALVALLLAPKDEVMEAQLAALAQKGLAALAQQARALVPLTRRLSTAFHMSVIDLALETVINADRRVSLHEFAVLTLVRSQVAPLGRPGAYGSRRIAELQPEIAVVLSLIAYAGVREDAAEHRAEALAAAMRAGAKEMGLPEAPAAGALRLEVAAAALQALKDLAPMQKAILVKGLFAAVSADGTIRVVEAELMRLVGAVLDCPLPPLLESVDPATLSE